MKRMTKPALALILAMSLALALAACGGNNGGTSGGGLGEITVFGIGIVLEHNRDTVATEPILAMRGINSKIGSCLRWQQFRG